MSSTGGSGGCDRDKSRKYASRRAKRKAKKERLAWESKVLIKVSKILCQMFSMMATSRVGDPGGDAPCKSTDA